MLVVHIISSPGWELGLHQQIDRLSHPLITVHICPHIPGDLLAARAEGIRMGINPYVAWVDADDVVLDTLWVDQALETLNDRADVSAVFCRWISTIDGKTIYTTPNLPWRSEMNGTTVPAAHTFSIMRRANVERVVNYALTFNTPIQSKIDTAIITAQQYFGHVLINPTIGYQWCLHEGGARNNKNSIPATCILSRLRNGEFLHYQHK